MQMTIMIGDVKLQSPCMTQWVQRYEVGGVCSASACACVPMPTALVARSRYGYGYGYGCQGSQVGGQPTLNQGNQAQSPDPGAKGQETAAPAVLVQLSMPDMPPKLAQVCKQP